MTGSRTPEFCRYAILRLRDLEIVKKAEMPCQKT